MSIYGEAGDLVDLPSGCRRARQGGRSVALDRASVSWQCISTTTRRRGTCTWHGGKPRHDRLGDRRSATGRLLGPAPRGCVLSRHLLVLPGVRSSIRRCGRSRDCCACSPRPDDRSSGGRSAPAIERAQPCLGIERRAVPAAVGPCGQNGRSTRIAAGRRWESRSSRGRSRPEAYLRTLADASLVTVRDMEGGVISERQTWVVHSL